MTSAARPLPHWLTVSTSPAPAVADGRACRTRAAFFEEVARVLRLPGYFGRNWDALTDSLRDATRDANVTLIVEHAEDLLGAEPLEQFATLLAVLADAGLTVTFSTDREHEAQLRQRVAAALA
jgi:RNAse (barnase) inhibitor barstar